MSTETINVYGIDLKVNFIFTKGKQSKLYGRPEDRQPEEPPEIEIISVLSGPTNIYEILSYKAIERIEEIILEMANQEPDYL